MSVMRAVYRGLLTFVTRTTLLAALLLPLSYSAQPRISKCRRTPELRLTLDPAWAAEVDGMIDRGKFDEIQRQDARSIPVLIDRLMDDERGDPAAKTLELLLEARGITADEGNPIRIRPRWAEQHDALARWYLENRRRMEIGW